MKKLLTAVSLLILAQPAFAQTVIESDFRLKINEGQAGEVIESSTLVPLMAGACYEWRLKLGKVKDAVAITEVFTLPSDPGNWESDQETTISKDGMTATSTMALTPVDGWIWHGWCVADGDPTGDYLIEVRSGDKVLGSFPFVLEAM